MFSGVVIAICLSIIGFQKLKNRWVLRKFAEKTNKYNNKTHNPQVIKEKGKNSFFTLLWPFLKQKKSFSYRSNFCHDWGHLHFCAHDFSFCHFQPICQFPIILPNFHPILCSPPWYLFSSTPTKFQRVPKRTLVYSWILNHLYQLKSMFFLCLSDEWK